MYKLHLYVIDFFTTLIGNVDVSYHAHIKYMFNMTTLSRTVLDVSIRSSGFKNWIINMNAESFLYAVSLNSFKKETGKVFGVGVWQKKKLSTVNI